MIGTAISGVEVVPDVVLEGRMARNGSRLGIVLLVGTGRRKRGVVATTKDRRRRRKRIVRRHRGRKGYCRCVAMTVGSHRLRFGLPRASRKSRMMRIATLVFCVDTRVLGRTVGQDVELLVVECNVVVSKRMKVLGTFERSLACLGRARTRGIGGSVGGSVSVAVESRSYHVRMRERGTAKVVCVVRQRSKIVRVEFHLHEVRLRQME
jgi:hypothetical protein